MAKNFICLLDIGSFSIKSLLVKEGKEGFSLVGAKETFSSGVREGNVVFEKKCLNAIERNIALLEEEHQLKINQFFVVLGGTAVSPFKNKGVVSVSRPDNVITEEDCERVLKEAKSSQASLGKEFLEVLEQKFFLDNQIYFHNPVGLKALKLEAEILGIEIISSYFRTFEEMFSQSDFEIETIPFPLALSVGVPSEKEKEIGVCVVDFGGDTSSFVLIKEGKIVDFWVSPFGSSQLTKEIAIEFKISYENAEKIKVEYGNAYFKGRDKIEKIELEEEAFFVSQKKLCRIIQNVLGEIFTPSFTYLKEILKTNKFAGGFIFVGGGSKLKNLTEFLKNKFSFYIKKGQMSGLEGFENNLSFAKLLGGVLALREGSLTQDNFSDKLRKIFKKIF